MNHPFLTNPETDLEQIIIETLRCRIEPFHLEWIDFIDLTNAFVQANENFYVSEHHPNVDQERDFIASTIENRKNSKAFECFIKDKKSSELIGSVGISDLDTPEPNLGLWIRKEYHGRWYGTEAYAAMLEWIREETNFSFFKHTVDQRNTASIRLATHFQWKLQETLTERGHLKYYIFLKD